MKKRKTDTMLRAGIGLLMVALLITIYAGFHEQIVIAGDTAPEFALKTDDGRTVSLHNFGGKLLVLNFWAAWCQPCRDETPSLSQFATAYAPKGVVVLGISVDKNQQVYNKFLERFKPAFLTVRDTKLHAEYGTFMYPETYIIDPQGKVLKKIVEPVNWTAPDVTGYFDSLL